jgi:hypothetical protein
MKNNSFQKAGGQGEDLARQAVIAKIESHDELTRKARETLGDDWKNATLTELRKFMMTQNVKE